MDDCGKESDLGGVGVPDLEEDVLHEGDLVDHPEKVEVHLAADDRAGPPVLGEVRREVDLQFVSIVYHVA